MCKALSRHFLTPHGLGASLNGKHWTVRKDPKSRWQGAISMLKNLSYRILIIGLNCGLCLGASVGVARAQQYVTNSPTQADMYCSGDISDQAVPHDSYVISG